MGTEPARPQPCPHLHAHWLYRIPLVGLATNFVATVLGAADGAMAAYSKQLEKRIRPHTGQPRLDNPLAYVRLAESDLDLRAATAFAEDRWRRMGDDARLAPPTDHAAMFRTRGDDAHVGRLAVQAVDRIMAAAGGTATMSDRPIQRYWRDIHAATGHVAFDLENRLIIVGRHLVGLPPDPTLL